MCFYFHNMRLHWAFLKAETLVEISPAVMFKNDIEYAVFNSTKNVSYAIFWMHMPNFL